MDWQRAPERLSAGPGPGLAHVVVLPRQALSTTSRSLAWPERKSRCDSPSAIWRSSGIQVGRGRLQGGESPWIRSRGIPVERNLAVYSALNFNMAGPFRQRCTQGDVAATGRAGIGRSPRREETLSATGPGRQRAPPGRCSCTRWSCLCCRAAGFRWGPFPGRTPSRS